MTHRIQISMPTETWDVISEKVLFLKQHKIRVNISELAREGIIRGIQVRLQTMLSDHEEEHKYHTSMLQDIHKVLK